MDIIDNTYNEVSQKIKFTRKEIEDHISELDRLKEFLFLHISEFFDNCLNDYASHYKNLNSIEKMNHISISTFRNKISGNTMPIEDLKKAIEYDKNDITRSLSLIIENKNNSLIKALDISCQLFNKLKDTNLDNRALRERVRNQKCNLTSSNQSIVKDNTISFLNDNQNSISEKLCNNQNYINIKKNIDLNENRLEKNRDDKKTKKQEIRVVSSSNSNNNFLKQKRGSPLSSEEIILEKMEKEFNNEFDHYDLLKLDNMILNTIHFSKKKDKIFKIKEETEEKIGKMPFTKYMKLKLTSTKVINFEFIEQISIFFKSFVISEKKENSKNIYLIGGELKTTYFVTIFKIMKQLVEDQQEYNFDVKIENYSFYEDVIKELTSPMIRMMKCFQDNLRTHEIISKNIVNREKIEKMRSFYKELRIK